MNQQLFLDKFTEQLEGYKGTPISLETEFRTIDVWDSLTGVAVQIMISDDFESVIPDSEFMAAQTVGDLFEMAKKYKA